MNAVIYTRVSPSPDTREERRALATMTPEQRAEHEKTKANLSLDAQLKACRDYAARKGYSVIGEFSDLAISGKDQVEDRPGLQEVITRSAKHPDVVVIVYSLSRLSRRQRLTWQLLDDRGDYQLQVESASEPFDTSTPIGKAMLGMLAVWSQLEADMTSERTTIALAARRARGLPLGATPLNLKAPEIVQQVQDLYATGQHTHASLADRLNELGIPTAHGKKWHATTVARVLKQTV